MADDLHYVPGDFYRLDDRSGFKVRAKRQREEWTGLIVDKNLWEARPSQDFVKGVRDDQTVPEPRPRQNDHFVGPLQTTLIAPATPGSPPRPPGAISSAGVFDANGVLVRTMWSAQVNDPRAANPAWDGMLDDGTVAPTGTYTVKLLQNNVQYHWDGAVANSSPDHTNVFYHTNFTTFNDMSASSTELYFSAAYHERNPTPQVVKISDPQTVRPIVPNDFRLPYLVGLFTATDGVLAYVGTQNGSTDSFVWAVSTTDGAEFERCLKTIHTFSGGSSYTYGRVSTVAGLDITAAQGSIMSGLAVQQVGGTVSSYLFLARGIKGQILTLDKSTGVTLHTNTTWIFPQRLATNPITGEVWVIHDNTGAISSGTYNSTTGVITLTMALSVSYLAGASVHLIGLTGTGAFASFNDGVFTAIAPTSGTTVTLQGPIGAGASTITGGNASVGGTIEKLSCDAGGNLTSSGVTITSLQNPLALNVTFDGATLLVCDGGTSHQVKAFNTSDGSVKTAFGTSGVFGTAGGYVNSPAVTNTKFMFRTGVGDGESPAFITCVPDGSFWVGDIGNYRYLHFSSGNSPTYIEQISCTPVAYSVRLCRGDSTRLFVDFLEYKIDYTKPLSPTNGSWTLANNWFGNVTPAFFPPIDVTYTGQNQYDFMVSINPFTRMIDAFVAPNGRTYACGQISSSDKRVFELTSTGLRVCMSNDVNGNGALPFAFWYIDTSFNLWAYSAISAGSAFTVVLNAFSNFTAAGDPIWLDIGIGGAESPGQGTGVVQYTSQVMPANTNNPGNFAEFSHIEALANGVTPIFNPQSQFVSPDTNCHLLGVNLVTGKLSIKTHLPNPGANTNPNPNFGGWNDDLTFLNYPEAPFFPVANGVGNNGGGPLHFIPGDTHFFTGYRGEDWANNQVNVWSHWHETGLLLNRFGPVGPYSGAAGCGQISEGAPKISLLTNLNLTGLYSWLGMPGFAGNSAWGGFTLVNGVYYIFQNDEWYHGGPSRWSITNTSSIQLTSQNVSWNSGSFVPPNDPTNLLQGLPYLNDNLPNGTASWQRNPTSNIITSGESSPFFVVYTNATTCDRFNPDLAFQATAAANYTLSRAFPAGGTGDWTLSGKIFNNTVNIKRPGVDPLNTATTFIDILDNAGKVIVRQFIAVLEDGVTWNWWVNNIVKVTDATGAFAYNAQAQTPFSIVGHVGSGVINIVWGIYSASVSSPFDPLANTAAPASLLITYAATGGNVAGLGFSKLNWVRLP